jgi:hypothetical protein
MQSSEIWAKIDLYLTRITPFGFGGSVLVAKDDKITEQRGRLGYPVPKNPGYERDCGCDRFDHQAIGGRPSLSSRCREGSDG